MGVYQPAQWHDFFSAVAGGGAMLTGLVVVAMSIHLEVVRADPGLLHAARMILVGLVALFARCSLALVGGLGRRGVAIDIFVVCLVVMMVRFVSYRPVSKIGTRQGSALVRTVAGDVFNIAEMLGALLLFFGAVWGLIVAAVAMICTVALSISSTWLLLLATEPEQTAVT